MLTAANINTALSYTAANSSDLSNYVKKSGDTMTGSLVSPSNGLTVGTNQFVVSGGNVGIGTASPAAAVDVAQTWNNGVTTFTGIKQNITDTASSGGFFAYGFASGWFFCVCSE